MKKENVSLLSDEQLIDNAKGGDALSEEVLIERYKPMVIKLSRLYYITGSDLEDAIAEGIVGEYRAIKSFDKERGVSFSTYCYSCISNTLLNVLKGAGRYKNIPPDMCVPIDQVNIPDSSMEEKYINQEEVVILQDKIKNAVSEMEYKVLEKYLSGERNKEIAESLSCTTKDVENALFRARKKIAKRLKEKK